MGRKVADGREQLEGSFWGSEERGPLQPGRSAGRPHRADMSQRAQPARLQPWGGAWAEGAVPPGFYAWWERPPQTPGCGGEAWSFHPAPVQGASKRLQVQRALGSGELCGLRSLCVPCVFAHIGVCGSGVCVCKVYTQVYACTGVCGTGACVCTGVSVHRCMWHSCECAQLSVHRCERAQLSAQV